MNHETDYSHSKYIGIWYAVAAYTAWGFLPLYWKGLQQVPAAEILAHRILWSFLFVSAILVVYGRWRSIKEVIADRKNRIGIFLGALMISANWFIYIWAINADQIVEASLGYYINPILMILLGLAVLRERLDFWQLISVLMASTGVAIITLQYGKIPWVALSLALTFGLYGLVKKLVKVDSIIGLALETIFVAPVALIYVITKQLGGTGSFGTVSFNITLLLICSGVATATPLLWFAQGAKRVPLSTIGFIQYLSPSISLLLGIFLYKEQFTKVHLISFGFIWCALVMYTVSRTSFMRQLQPKYFQ